MDAKEQCASFQMILDISAIALDLKIGSKMGQKWYLETNLVNTKAENKAFLELFTLDTKWLCFESHCHRGDLCHFVPCFIALFDLLISFGQ